MGAIYADVAELAKGGRLKICSLAVHRFESGRRHHHYYKPAVVPYSPQRFSVKSESPGNRVLLALAVIAVACISVGVSYAGMSALSDRDGYSTGGTFAMSGTYVSADGSVFSVTGSAVLEFREESDSYRAYTLEIALSYDGSAGSSAAGPDTIGTGIIFGRDGVPLDCVRRGSGDIELEDGSTVSAEIYVRTDGGYTYMYHVGEKCRILEISVQTADMSSGCWLSLSGR